MTDSQPGSQPGPSDSPWQPPSATGYPSHSEPTLRQEPVYPVTPSTEPGTAVGGQPATEASPPGTTYPVSGYPVAAYPVGPTQNTNGMAIASLVVSIVGMVGLCAYGLGGYLGIVGAILGQVARRQIRERGENGDGLALAGVIIGWIAGGIAILATIGLVALIGYAISQDSN